MNNRANIDSYVYQRLVQVLKESKHPYEPVTPTMKLTSSDKSVVKIST